MKRLMTFVVEITTHSDQDYEFHNDLLHRWIRQSNEIHGWEHGDRAISTLRVTPLADFQPEEERE